MALRGRLRRIAVAAAAALVVGMAGGCTASPGASTSTGSGGTTAPATSASRSGPAEYLTWASTERTGQEWLQAFAGGFGAIPGVTPIRFSGRGPRSLSDLAEEVGSHWKDYTPEQQAAITTLLKPTGDTVVIDGATSAPGARTSAASAEAPALALNAETAPQLSAAPVRRPAAPPALGPARLARQP